MSKRINYKQEKRLKELERQQKKKKKEARKKLKAEENGTAGENSNDTVAPRPADD
ncbi:MAG: hypothetical protein N839_0011885 [Desulfofustis sp. PB-SRB1]|nr:hypothetical protein [Desulfofustis sp. PB-SRB1]MBM1003097.1 hypothetical protein [Desulfofustis sp. PB-SRB1]